MNVCLVLCDVIAEHCLAILIPPCGNQMRDVEAYFWAVASAPCSNLSGGQATLSNDLLVTVTN